MTGAVRNVAPATLADLAALPAHLKGELIEGVLYAMTRPRGRHQSVAGAIQADYQPPYQRGRGGPGGWWILPEPGVELPGAPEISPDVAGWRRERLPELPLDAAITVVPDWVCEVLSPSTASTDRTKKLPIYRREGIGHAWLIDPTAHTLEVFRRHDLGWLLVASFEGASLVRAEPFDAIELDLSGLWVD